MKAALGDVRNKPKGCQNLVSFKEVHQQRAYILSGAADEDVRVFY